MRCSNNNSKACCDTCFAACLVNAGLNARKNMSVHMDRKRLTLWDISYNIIIERNRW